MPKSSLPGSNSPSALASRRALLAGATGAAGALALETVTRTPTVVANTGDAILAGKSNKAGAPTTLRNDVIVNGPGSAAMALILKGADANNTNGTTCFAGPITAGTGMLSTGGSAGGFCNGPEVEGGAGIEARGGIGVGGQPGGVGILARGGSPGGVGMIATTGSGTADGIQSTGGGSGSGVRGDGGPSSGHGIHGHGGAPNGNGVVGFGTGTGDGVRGTGGGSNAPGVHGIGGATNGVGVKGEGTGTGDGVFGTGGPSSGDGVHGVGGGPNGSGIHGEGVGNGAGVFGRGHGGGAGVIGLASTSGNGVQGTALGSGSGVKGSTAFQQGIGVTAENAHGGIALQVNGDAKLEGRTTFNGPIGVLANASFEAAASFAGPAIFARAGVVSIPSGASSAVVSPVGLVNTDNIVLAVMQNTVGAVMVKAAFPFGNDGKVKIVLNQAVPTGNTARVGWFVLN